jgi:hypothetical protein
VKFKTESMPEVLTKKPEIGHRIILDGDNELVLIKKIKLDIPQKDTNFSHILQKYQGDNLTFRFEADKDDDATLAHLCGDPMCVRVKETAGVYRHQTRKDGDDSVGHSCLPHQVLFKLSGDGNLRKLSLISYQIHELIIRNQDFIFEKNEFKDHVSNIVIMECSNAVYPIEIRPIDDERKEVGISLRSLHDLTNLGYPVNFIVSLDEE